MNRSSALVLGTAFAAAAFAATVVTTSAAAAPAPVDPAATHYTPAPCARAKAPGQAVCHSTIWTPGGDHQPAPATDGPPATALGPADVQAAYRLPAGGGGGQTVAIVDAYGNSHAEDDLAVFRSEYGLPACTTANGCFTKLDQRGGTDYPADDSGWGLETALDLDAVSAACPACNILLVEGDSADIDDLGQSVDTAVAAGAKYVSNSYGVPGEFPDETQADDYYNHRGVAVLASTGDTGNVTNWPAANPNVVAVGGTTLTKDTGTDRGWTESAWADGGSGCSPFEAKPDYQLRIDTACAKRAIADLSADADPQTGLAVYDTLGSGGWQQVGGTSLSSPLVAAMYAIAGPPASGNYPVANLYDPKHAKQFNDVTDGSNGNCGTVLCTAGRGWDGPTGLGTPNGVAALRQGPHGAITGTVTDASTDDPVPNATVTLSDAEQTRTDAQGHYVLSGVDVGTYSVTVSAYGFATTTRSGVDVANGDTTHADVVLHPVPSATVSGTVTDGGSHHWPLYAEIDIAEYPNGALFTDPTTGRYSVRLPRAATYHVTVTPIDGGYQPVQQALTLRSAPTVTADFAPTVDASSCTAAGYGWNGTGTDFLGWPATKPIDGWTLTGTTAGWRFDNPGYRVQPPGGDDNFAIADDSYVHNRSMSTTLTSPTVDLRGQSSPKLTFATGYVGTAHSTATAAVSTDGGSTWTTVWSRRSGVANGTVTVPLAGPTARVRFSYQSTSGGYWSLDNVFAGTRQCVAQRGGLVIGQVTDTAGHPLPGATVRSAADRTHPAVAVATPGDRATGDALYWLFVPAGDARLTAGRAGYQTQDAVVAVAANRVTVHNWSLRRSH